MIAGFKEFISRGNAIDLAVGVIIGAAFSEVVNALVNSVFNPLIGAIFGKPNFDQVLQFEIGLWGEPAVVSPGAVFNALINLLIVAIALYFCVVLPLNKLAARKKVAEEEPAAASAEVQLLTEIRDSLKTQS